MRGYMFQNRWWAAGFVCLMAFGAAQLVGTEDNEGALIQATGQLEGQRDAFTEDMEKLNPAPSQSEFFEESSEFASEEDLVDTAEGFDPTPNPEESDFGAESTTDPGQVITTRPAVRSNRSMSASERRLADPDVVYQGEVVILE